MVVTTITVPSSRPSLAGPRPLRWTCAEFHRFGDLGVFEGRRAMLIDGVVLEQGPMNPPHAITLGLVAEALRTAFGDGWRFRSQSPLILGQDLDPRPDFAVITGRPRGSSAARADITGKAVLPGVPPGTYYMLVSIRISNQPILWDVKLDLKPGANSLTLDPKNAVPLK